MACCSIASQFPFFQLHYCLKLFFHTNICSLHEKQKVCKRSMVFLLYVDFLNHFWTLLISEFKRLFCMPISFVAFTSFKYKIFFNAGATVE